MKAGTSGAHGAAILAREGQLQKGNPTGPHKQAFHYSAKKTKPHSLTYHISSSQNMLYITVQKIVFAV